MGTSPTNTEYKEIIVVSNYDGSAYSGLSSSNFSISYLLNGEAYSDEITHSISEVGSTGKYIYTVEFPLEGTWLSIIQVLNSTETVETHYINIKVQDSTGTYLSSKKDGISLGPFDSINFVGSNVEVSRQGSELTVSVITTNQVPAEAPGESSITASVGGSVGTLTFSSRSN